MRLFVTLLKGKNVDEAFEIIRNALANLEDETLRVGIANDIFGEKIGTDLQQLLSASSTEIDNFRNECQELGVITEEEVEASAKFNDELDKVKQELQTLGVELAQILLPIMTEFLTYLKDSIIPKISEWANKLANMNDTTKKTILVVIGLVAAIGPAIKIITTIIPIVKGLSTALCKRIIDCFNRYWNKRLFCWCWNKCCYFRNRSFDRYSYYGFNTNRDL